MDDGLVYFKGETGVTSFEKRDQSGVLTWTVDVKNMLGVSATNSINIDSHATLKDSGFVFSCQVYNASKFWSYLVKLDKNGNLTDTVKYDQTALTSLAEASNGKILACYMSFVSSKIHSGLLVIDKTLSVNNFYPSPFTYNTNNFGKICPNNTGGGMISISLQPTVTAGPGYAYLVNFDSLINTYPFKYKGFWGLDKNKDCNLGAGDDTYPYQLLKIKEASSSSDKYCLTNNLGEYSTSLPNGTYTVTHAPFSYRNYECPSTGGYTFNVTGAGLSTGNNLLDTLVPSVKEVSNVIFSNEFVPGFNSFVQIFIPIMAQR
ncbi:MAG: hypothetical protein IPJ32_05215 [Sphingobacteriaceae bacterium]|nr:hypothetical protein [Sphingobacteriaceae bacterium]